jgi:thiamine biosynthesis lipoprotein ApbE
MRSPFLATLLLCLANPALSAQHSFHADHILGTSLDLTAVCERPADAQAAYRAVLHEVERLRRILSTYDPASDISRLQRATSPATYPRELVEVLEACAAWQARSQGAFSPQVGPLIALWQAAQKQDRLPDEATLAQAVRDIAQPAWQIGTGSGVILRRGSTPLNVDALAKGYILDKALAATRTIPAVEGALLDIGGDVATWGKSPEGDAWRVGVADPARPQENAPLLARLRLRDRAVATSGAYARYYTVAGRRYSHIFDPRTGMPAEQAASATAVAATCADADALATILCVLPPDQGLQLVESMRSRGADTACLLILPDGRQLASAGWANVAEPMAQAEAAVNPAWPKGHGLTIAVTIAAQTSGRKSHRPYVATWITNDKGEAVRTLQVWGREKKYLRDLPKWWAFAQKDSDMVRAVTRASRSPGRYEVAWDGLDDKGKPVPAGTYTVFVESNREKGGHVVMSGKIDCADKPASGKIEGNKEIQSVEMKFGPQGDKP